MDKNSANIKHKNDKSPIEAKESILQAASWINQVNYQTLKPFNISIHQFHVLRILYVTHPDPLTLSEITNRMPDKMSNASRIVERLCIKNFVQKNQDDADKRKANVVLTEEGKELMVEAIKTLEEKTFKVMQKLSPEEIIQLRDLSNKLSG